MIRIAAVQIDSLTAAYEGSVDYLKEPISFLKGMKKCGKYRGNCGASRLAFGYDDINTRLQLFLSREIKDAYTDFLLSKLFKIIDYCNEQGANLIVFPEYSVPASCLGALRERVDEISAARGHPLVVVAGSHTVITENREVYERLGLTQEPDKLNLDNDHRKAISPVLFGKDDIPWSEKIENTLGDSTLTPGERLPLFEIKVSEKLTYTFVNLICIDYIADRNPEVANKFQGLFNRADFIVVPAYTPDIRYFERNFMNHIEGYKKPGVFANGTDGGGTSIMCQFHPPYLQQLSSPYVKTPMSYVIPKGSEGIVVVDLDPKRQFIEHPTSLNNVSPSRQVCVAPVIYSHCLKELDEISAMLMKEKDIEGKRTLLRDNARTIRSWGEDSQIFKDKIVRLYHNTYNLRPEEIEFYLSHVKVDTDPDPIDTMTEWSLQKLKKTVKELGNIQYEYVNQLTEDEIKELQLTTNYYRDIIIKMSASSVVKKREKMRIKFRNKNIRILSVYQSPSFSLFLKQLTDDVGYNISASKDEGLDPMANAFAKKLAAKADDYDAILMLYSEEDAFIFQLEKLPKDLLKRKCIILSEEGAFRYSKELKDQFYRAIELSSLKDDAGGRLVRPRKTHMDLIDEAIKEISQKENAS